MGKKKAFVDKKTSATFRLVCRDSSASDGFGHLAGDSDRVFTRVDEGNNYVPGFTDDDPRTQLALDPNSIFADANEDSEEELLSNSMQKSDPLPKAYHGRGSLPDHVRREIIELGFPDDGYNYLLHLREIRSSGGGSAFVPNTKARLEYIQPDVKAYDASKLQVQTYDEEVSNFNAFNDVSASTFHVRRLQKAVDPEVAANLEKSDGSEFGSDVEDLEEDFVIQANKPEEEEEEKETTSGELIKAKEGEHADTIQCSSAQDNTGASLSKTSSSGDLGYATDGIGNVHLVESKKQRIPRLLDEQFELLALREYSDDDSDAADIHDYDVMGAGDGHVPQIDVAMKEFLTDNLNFQDKYTVPADVYIHNTGEKSSQKQNGTLVHDFVKPHLQGTSADDLLRKCAEYAEMYANESAEEKEFVLVEDSSGTEDEVWDCETIVSTYSNMDNHPAKISAPQKLSTKNISESLRRTSDLNTPVISLQGQQQLPVDFLPQRQSMRKGRKSDRLKSETRSVTSGVSGHSKAGETLEQKKARKAAVKDEKREARRAKKEMKTLYKGESQRAQHVVAISGPPAIHLM
eukprot:Gb_13741 [translate_table: standard]